MADEVINDNAEEEVVEQPEVNSESQDAADEADVMVKALLGDEEESQDATGTETVQPETKVESQGEEEKESEQPEAETYEIFEDEYEVLTKELGYTDDDLDQFSKEDVKNILESKTAKPQPEDTSAETAIPDIIITKEIAEKYGGFAKSFVGQPISELFKAIELGNKHSQKLSVENKQLKTLTNQAKTKEADEILKTLKESKDLTEEQFWEGIDKYNQLRVEAAIEAAKVEPSESEKESEAFNQLQGVLTTRFPQKAELDARKTWNEWWGSLDENMQAAYAKSDRRTLENAIFNYIEKQDQQAEIARLKAESEQREKDKIKDAKTTAAKIVVDSIRGANGKPVTGTHHKIVPRSTKADSQKSDVMVTAILEDRDE